MKRIFLISMLLILVISVFSQKRLNKEVYYQNKFVERMGGNIEVVLDDRTRVDILLDEYAIEVDFANKWAEGIGQSLYYALKTGKKPGVVLIMENLEKDKKYLYRLDEVAKKYNITVWMISATLNLKMVTEEDRKRWTEEN